MKTLLETIKEANKDIRDGKVSEQDISNHYIKYYPNVQDRIESFNTFETVCLMDFRFNFPNPENIKNIQVNPNNNPDLKELVPSNNKIKKYSELHKEHLALIEKAKDSYPLLTIKPNIDFDEHGLRHDIHHLNAIHGAIIFIPLEEMAEYCDVVTKAFTDANDVDYEIKQYNKLIEEYSDSIIIRFNSTSIGNFAYIVLHSKFKPLADVSLIILNKYYELIMQESKKAKHKNLN